MSTHSLNASGFGPLIASSLHLHLCHFNSYGLSKLIYAECLEKSLLAHSKDNLGVSYYAHTWHDLSLIIWFFY